MTTAPRFVTMIVPFILVTFLVGVSSAEAEHRVVETAQGPVKGYKVDDGDYFSFYGIPYATSPKGRDRFKSPLPPPTWSHVFEATDNRAVCPQPAPLFQLSFQEDLMWTEDCLNLNIFVPVTRSEQLLPVLVYIHGGGYAIGSGNMIGYKHLMQHGIIIVNFNFRLGAFGFLCLATESVPGNAGAKDQMAALKWVQDNIAKFGGNPQKVTLAGFSAGAAAAELLMLSDRTKGLFQKVIAESSSTLAPWAIQYEPLKIATMAAEQIGYEDTQNITDLEEFYMNVKSEELLKLDFSSSTDTSIGFVPCIEQKSEFSFLSEAPATILKSGTFEKVPFMTGFGNKEGMFQLPSFEKWSKEMNEDFAKFLPIDLSFNDVIERNNVIERIKLLYFEDKAVNVHTIHGYIDYFTDILFGYPIIRSARSHARASNEPVFLYYFSYVGELSPPKTLYSHVEGVDHIGQCFYLHDFSTFFKSNATSKDLLIRERMTKMWANFVKYGNPIPEPSSLLPVSWPEVNGSGTPHLTIGSELETSDVLLAERVRLWDAIYDAHYRKPSAPSLAPLKENESTEKFEFNPIPEPSSLLPVSWPEVNGSDTPHLTIGSELETSDVLLAERVRLWDAIYDAHYRKPSAPSLAPLKENESTEKF